MDDLTVVYYTSNQEKAPFETAVKRDLLAKAGGLPIISVSQKPIDFGTNICVGEGVGLSGHNVYRQMQLGAIAATTTFICTAESDNLYPPDYFHFKPAAKDVFYVATPMYVFFAQKRKVRAFSHKPRGSESAMVVGREYLIRGIDEMLAGRPRWAPGDTGMEFPYLFKGSDCRKQYFVTDVPVISVKTDNQLHRRTPHSGHTKTRTLPYWGTASEFCDKYALVKHENAT